MWCVCSNTCWSNPKRFLSVLFVFESDFILSCLMFLFKMHFCIFLQKLVQRLSHKKLVTYSFPRKGLKGNKLFHLVTQKLSRLYRDYLTTNSFLRNAIWIKLDFSKIRQKLPRLYRDCFATSSFSRKLMCINGLSHDCLAIVSLLFNPRKTRVFSF